MIVFSLIKFFIQFVWLSFWISSVYKMYEKERNLPLTMVNRFKIQWLNKWQPSTLCCRLCD